MIFGIYVCKIRNNICIYFYPCRQFSFVFYFGRRRMYKSLCSVTIKKKSWMKLTWTSKCVVVSCGCGGPCCCCCCCEGGGPCGGGGACAPKSCAAACECGCCRWWVGGAWWCCRWCGGAGANAAMKCSSLPTTSIPGFNNTTPPPPLTARVAAAFFWNSSSPGEGWRLPGVRLQQNKNQSDINWFNFIKIDREGKSPVPYNHCTILLSVFITVIQI